MTKPTKADLMAANAVLIEFGCGTEKNIRERNIIAQAIATARDEERAACAKLVLSDEGSGDIDFIAQLIRARGGAA